MIYLPCKVPLKASRQEIVENCSEDQSLVGVGHVHVPDNIEVA